MSDPLLAPFTEAADEDAAERALEALLEERLIPLVRRIAARKLRAYSGAEARAFDLEDVVSDAALVLVDRLGELRRSADAPPIASLLDYTAVVAFNACAHYVRRTHPERARLKNRLRYVLAHRGALAVWTVESYGAVCGLAAWRGRAPDPAAAAAVDALAAAGAPEPAASADALGRYVEDVLRPLPGPVGLDAFVGAMARVFGVTAPRAVPLPDLPARTRPREEAIDDRRALLRTREEIGALPVRQRVAMLLSLRDPRGASPLFLLPVLGIASVRDIAAVLGWSADALAAVWPGLPLDDNAIAARLGCTRQQVINLRHSARKRLWNRLRAEPAAPAGRANLRAVPSSLESET
jgi:DNA-directed RNA polymerase specialized sigma24 family protein